MHPHLACPSLASLPAPPCPQKSDFEERLQRLSAQYRIPREGNTTVARVEAAARRVLQGQEVAWHSDILAKVGGWVGQGGWANGQRSAAVWMMSVCDTCGVLDAVAGVAAAGRRAGVEAVLVL